MEFQNFHRTEQGLWERTRTHSLAYIHVEELLSGLFLAETVDHSWHFIDAKTGEPQTPIMIKRPIIIDKERSIFQVYPYVGDKANEQCLKEE